MKDTHKQKVGSLVEASTQRLEKVLSMMEGKHRPDNESAKDYVRTVIANLDRIQNFIDIA